jgi:hypothetical protein
LYELDQRLLILSRFREESHRGPIQPRKKWKLGVSPVKNVFRQLDNRFSVAMAKQPRQQAPQRCRRRIAGPV